MLSSRVFDLLSCTDDDKPITTKDLTETTENIDTWPTKEAKTEQIDYADTSEKKWSNFRDLGNKSVGEPSQLNMQNISLDKKSDTVSLDEIDIVDKSDYYFLMSLNEHLKNLTLIKKLKFQREILRLVEKYVE